MRQITIQHREYICDVTQPASETFTCTFRPVNPAFFPAFPWLSAIAARFEMYRWNKLNYEYVPVVGTSIAGSVALIPDYDAADDNSHRTKAELFTFADTARCSVWDTMVQRCRPEHLCRVQRLYTRDAELVTTAGSTGMDLKTYDALQIGVALSTVSVGTNTQYGELWAEYSVTLYTPQLSQSLTHREYTGGVTPTLALPIAGLSTARNNFPVEILETHEPTQTLTFKKPGNYEIELYNGGSTGITAYPDLNITTPLKGGDLLTLSHSSTSVTDFYKNWTLAVDDEHTADEPLTVHFTGGNASTYGDGWLNIEELFGLFVA